MTTPNSTKHEVLEEIATLAIEHHLSAEEIKSAIHAKKNTKPTTETYMRLLAYLGGIFIFSGICIYIGVFWTSMSAFMKISLTLGTGLILYLLAMILPLYHKNNENMLTPLFLTSAFFQTVGLFVAFNELNVGMDLRVGSLLIFGVLLIQQFLTFRKTKRASLIFISIFFWCAFLVTFLDLLHASEKTIEVLVGLSVLSVAYVLDRKHYTANSSFWYFIGSVIFLNGLFDVLKNSWFEIGFFAISALLIYFSTLIKNRTLLFVGTLSSLSYIGYFTSKHFMHSTAWPILLVLLGIICFGVGVMVLKISKKYM